MLDIQETLSNFKKLNVLIVGDVMLDHYIHGSVNRISPEAPVPILDTTTKEYRLGGAANVALNIKALGATPYLCSMIGVDYQGDLLLDLLKKEDLYPKLVYTSKDRRTTCKTRVLAQNQQLLRIDEEDTHNLSKKDQQILLKSIRQLLEQKTIDAILFQDYNKGVLGTTIINELLLEAVRRDIPTTVDPKNTNFYAYNRVTLFKPNLREINQNIPFSIDASKEALHKAVTYLKSQLNNRQTLITLSDKGLYLENGEAQILLPTTPRIIADVCGAGDSVISIATLCIAAQLPAKEMAILCNLAGGQVCEKVGVVSVDPGQLAEDYERQIVL